MTLLPASLLDVALDGDRVRPRYLTTRDEGWTRALQDEVEALEGQPRRLVMERLGRAPGDVPRSRARRAMVRLLLGRRGFVCHAVVPPERLRAEVFAAAARAGRDADRRRVLARCAARLGVDLGLDPDLDLAVDAAAIAQWLYADVPDRRRLEPDPCPIATAELVAVYNLTLAQSLLWRAERVRATAAGSLKAVLRYARLQGLICTIEAPRGPVGAPALHLSGALSLFRHTTKYGRAMACWLPTLARAPAWSLAATCVLGGRRWRLAASHRDPIGSTHAPFRRFDSRVEERLFRDLKRLGTPWQVLREADAVPVGRHVLVPDFTLLDPARRARVPVEVLGFWTPEYLDHKLRCIAHLPQPARWLLCVDEDLAGAAGDRLPSGPLLTFRRRVDARRLVELAEQSVGGAARRR